jgi:hypothetical protein
MNILLKEILNMDLNAFSELLVYKYYDKIELTKNKDIIIFDEISRIW